MMPPGGAETRAKQEATLTVLARDLLVADDTRRLLDQAEAEMAAMPADSVERANCAQVREAIDYHLRIPGALVRQAGGVGRHRPRDLGRGPRGRATSRRSCPRSKRRWPSTARWPSASATRRTPTTR